MANEKNLILFLLLYLFCSSSQTKEPKLFFDLQKVLILKKEVKPRAIDK